MLSLDTAFMTELDEFIKNSYEYDRKWINGTYVKLYIRKQQIWLPGKDILDCVAIANVNVNPVGFGIYRELLTHIEQTTTQTVYIENVLDPEQYSIYTNRGYTMIPSDMTVIQACFYKLKSCQ